MQSKDQFTRVLDLDAILVKPLTFKLHGKWHTVEPLELDQFFAFWKGFTDLADACKTQDDEGNKIESNITLEQFHNLMYEIINPIAKTVTLDDIKSCQKLQLYALVDAIGKLVYGEQSSSEKKNLKMMELSRG